MILLFILAVCALQYGLYILNKRSKPKVPSVLIAILFLPLHFFVFPQLFFPPARPDGINCGMPQLGIVFVFWVFGTFGVMATHIFWTFKRKVHTKKDAEKI
ncbi:MAG: hypothetical protein COA80_14255 [Leeuwenhoekiella sp.]|nr:MAG: hypothetical protein COA80_14255 [Leeuwenhoekiella sp.]